MLSLKKENYLKENMIASISKKDNKGELSQNYVNFSKTEFDNYINGFQYTVSYEHDYSSWVTEDTMVQNFMEFLEIEEDLTNLFLIQVDKLLSFTSLIIITFNTQDQMLRWVLTYGRKQQ